MSDKDKMRAEFEAWAKANGFSVRFSSNGSYVQRWQAWQAAYTAGQKAERESIRLKNWDGLRLG